MEKPGLMKKNLTKLNKKQEKPLRVFAVFAVK